jgi:acylphosphatase
MKKAITIKIVGKVQGVFFRASTKEKADALGLKGTVKNERDGSVFVEAEGEESLLNDFASWCQRGPQMARVDKCEVTDANVKGFADFLINR